MWFAPRGSETMIRCPSPPVTFTRQEWPDSDEKNSLGTEKMSNGILHLISTVSEDTVGHFPQHSGPQWLSQADRLDVPTQISHPAEF